MSSIRLTILLLIVSCPLLIAAAIDLGEEHDHLQTYTIHVRPPPPEHTGTTKDWHESFVPHPSRLLHSFTHVIGGFAANLSPRELESIRKLEGFVSAIPSETLRLHTTHTPSFLGLNTELSGFWSLSAKYGEGVVLGVIDSGINPTHPSFNGTGMPLPPSKWRGKCNFNSTTLCNNKLIGARSFLGGKESPLSPYDDDGHGTHTAGTAAGQFVPNASVLGSAMGTAAGMAPRAHLAAYKVCWGEDCSSADAAAALDTAVGDGVDVVSISLGGKPGIPLYADLMAIAAFSAAKRGVFIAESAGNSGPSSLTVENIAPWVLTVGASTTDRRIRAVVKLGNGTELEGESAYQPSTPLPDSLPLVYPQWIGDPNASYCTNSTTLQTVGVQGKVVLCQGYNLDEIEKGKIVKEAGGAAMILWGVMERGYETQAKANIIPASHVSYEDGLTIYEYIASTADPVATIEFKGTAIGSERDPAVAAFSSRGPSRINSGILKPDIVGPGVNILAAWPTSVGPFPVEPPFNMISGTSMSCPHLAGIAAILKSAHPDWSPAMIKSAIMTTTDVTNLGRRPILDLYDGRRASFFAMGAGQVNPTRATNPGLVYDIQTDDYISYLCGLGYTDDQVRVITSDHTVECANFNYTDEANLNYPSLTVLLATSNNYAAQVGRTLTNVGSLNSSYTVSIARPYGITVDVQPARLDFASAREKQSFSVSFGMNSTESVNASPPWASEGYLIWSSMDGLIQVKSPISAIIVN